MDTENVIYIYHIYMLYISCYIYMLYYLMLGEINQAQKDKYHVLAHRLNVGPTIDDDRT
jgi:hypothetical protein